MRGLREQREQVRDSDGEVEVLARAQATHGHADDLAVLGEDGTAAAARRDGGADLVERARLPGADPAHEAGREGPLEPLGTPHRVDLLAHGHLGRIPQGQGPGLHVGDLHEGQVVLDVDAHHTDDLVLRLLADELHEAPGGALDDVGIGRHHVLAHEEAAAELPRLAHDQEAPGPGALQAAAHNQGHHRGEDGLGQLARRLGLGLRRRDQGQEKQEGQQPGAPGQWTHRAPFPIRTKPVSGCRQGCTSWCQGKSRSAAPEQPGSIRH